MVGTLTVFFDVAYQSYLPSLVGSERIVEGNSKLEVSRSGAQIAGPGLAGLLVSAITAPYAVAVDAVSFVWSALLVARIRSREPARRRVADRKLRREIVEGLRYLLGDPRWRVMTAYVATFNLGSGMNGPLGLVYAVRRLGLSPAQLGLVFMLGNLGWLGGALVARRVTERIGVGRTLALGAALGGAPLLLWPLTPRRGAAARRLDAARLVRSRALQHPGDQPVPDARAGPAARTDERVTALDRLGRAPARQPHRRPPRLLGRRAGDALRRRRPVYRRIRLPARKTDPLDRYGGR